MKVKRGVTIIVGRLCKSAPRIMSLLVATGMLLLRGTTAHAQNTNGRSLISSAINAPAGLAFDAHQNLFVSDMDQGDILRLRRGRWLLAAKDFEEPRDFVFDKRGNLYVTDTHVGTVYRLDKKGNTSILGIGLQGVCCVALDVDESVLVLHQSGTVENYAITRLTQDGKQTEKAAGFLNARGMIVDRDGNLIVAAEGYASSANIVAHASPLAVVGSGLFKIDELGQVTRLFNLGSISPSGLTLSLDGTLVFAGVVENTGAVFTANHGTFQPLATGFLAPHGLAANRRYVFVADEKAGQVWRVSLANRATNIVGAISSHDARANRGLAATEAESAKLAQSRSYEDGVDPVVAQQFESMWGYHGAPDYSQIPLTAEGVPSAPDGVTCTIGQILRTDDVPLGNVTVRLNRKAVRTNSSGYWMLTDVPAGRQLLLCDGRSADEGDIRYPITMIPSQLEANQANVLSFAVYFPVLDTAHKSQIDSSRETIHRTPLMPGVEIRVPAGTTITSIDGLPVTEITVTHVHCDKHFYPMGLIEDAGGHFTLQPGGAMASKPISVTFGNPQQFPAGTRVPLWTFDPIDHNDWWQYAMGTVSADGQEIMPDFEVPAAPAEANVTMPQATFLTQPKPPRRAGFRLTGCALTSTPSRSNTGNSPNGGEPVDLATGAFELHATDLVVPGLLSLVLDRIYRSQDQNVGPLGIGTRHGMNFRLFGNNYNPTAGSYIDFTDTSDSAYRFDYQTNFPVHTFANTNDIRFAGAKIYQTTSGLHTLDVIYDLIMKDGTKYAFDGYGRLRAIRDINNNQITIERDPSNVDKIIRITQPSGRYLGFKYNSGTLVSSVTDSAGRKVSYAYDASQRLVAVTNALGGVTQYAYDGTNNLTTITLPNNVQFLRNFYDSANRVTNQFLADGGTFSFSYTTNAIGGAVIQTVLRNPLNNPATYSFNALGFLTNHVDALGNSITFILNASNAITRVIDPLSRTNGFVYDILGNVTAMTNAQNKVTKLTYEPDFNRLTSVIDPLSRTNSFAYDGYGNLTSITNTLGKVTKVVYNQLGQPTSVTDPLNNTYTFTYNATLDLESVRDPLGNEVRWLIDSAGRPFALIDTFGRVTRINYDALNRVTSIVDPINGTTSLKYDSIGNLTNVTDALSHAVSYAYDVMNRLTSRTDQLSKLETYAYDKNGSVTNFVDRRGMSVSFQYDMLDRRTGIVYGSESSVKLFYDTVGRVTNIADSVGTTNLFTYDSLDRLVQETNTYAIATAAVNYGYNDAGLRTNMTASGQTPVQYFYDAANRLTNVVQGTLTSSLFYDDLGRRTKLILPNGINVLYSYDIASRLTNITYLAAATNKVAYGYDQIGNRASQASALAAYNLPSAISNSTYNAANQQTVFGSYNMLYDANGNVTNIISGAVTNALVWNARNQLTNMTGAATASFVYDGLGRRINRTINGASQRYTYDGLDAVIEHRGGAVKFYYFRGLGIDEPWGQARAKFATPATTNNVVYLADALGSIVAMTDSNQNVVTEYDYEPFGATTTTGSALTNSYRFTGREDDGTGLYYYRVRFYHPALGRFVSEDPFDMLDGPNSYLYVGNNPMSFFDPFGLLKSGCEELRNLRETYERKNVIKRYRQIIKNHKGAGDYDYSTNDPGETYSLRGKVKDAHEFTNYTAGYSAGYAGVLPQIDYVVLRVAGSAYGLSYSLNGGGWVASQFVPPLAGDDWVSVREMTLGYLKGKMDSFTGNQDDCDNCP